MAPWRRRWLLWRCRSVVAATARAHGRHVAACVAGVGDPSETLTRWKVQHCAARAVLYTARRAGLPVSTDVGPDPWLAPTRHDFSVCL